MSKDNHTCQIHQKYPPYTRIKCANPALLGVPDRLYILHSQDTAKDPAAFRAALRTIWDQEEYVFCGVFFPGRFNPEDFFGSREFSKPVNFAGATLRSGPLFPRSP